MKRSSSPHIKTIVSALSAAALVCGLCGPFASLPSAFAEGGGVSAQSLSASESSSPESSSSSSSASSEEESHEHEGKAGKDSKDAGSAGKGHDGKSEAKDSGNGSSRGGHEKASHAAAHASKGAGKAEAGEKSRDKASKEKASKKDEKSKKDAKDKKDKKNKKKSKKKKTATVKTSGEDPAKYANKIPALVTKLEAVPDAFGKTKKVTHDYKVKIARVDKQKATLQKEQQRAQNVLAEMQKELSGGTGATLTMVLTGRADFDSIDSRGYLLQKVADGSSKRIAQLTKDMAKLDQRKAKLQKQEKAEVERLAKQDKAHKAAMESALERGNELAAKVEENVSLMRYAEPKSTAARAALRKEALAAVAKWYEFEDAMAGNEGVLTFGTGKDFDLKKAAFVKKWGDAIDAFYRDYYPSAPLEGHGAEMAESAWKHKIDPRLCAAVSIIESTGGQYCIKPHNAWGWGAADSDPYGGASGWDSWADAIEAWHNGLATSTTGLATAPTVEQLGETYCSSLDWAAKVAEEMQKISAEAK